MVLEEFSKVIATKSPVEPIFLMNGTMMFKLFAITLRKSGNFSLEAKDLIINLRSVRYSFLLIIAFFSITLAKAQDEPTVKTPPGLLNVKPDTTGIQNDSLRVLSDSSAVKKDSTKAKAKRSDIETTINYSASDSIFSSLDNKMVWLYGDAKVKYGEIELEAEEIIIDYVNNTVTAHGVTDSLGQTIGYPIFKNGQELYETKDIIYNFKTKRARITEVVTKQGEGILHGDAVFKNEKGELLSIKNSYTTCNLKHPHFLIMATKTKAIPGDKIVAGPFYIKFNDIPLPIGFLFGMFPSQRTSKSGIIFPSYGEDRVRGFNLRNLGYFFDFNDYIKLALSADIYSKGGYSMYVRSNYNVRYKYNGSVNFSYSRTRLSDQIEDPNTKNDFYLTWSHTPQTKGTARFSASVTAATSSYNKNNNMSLGLSNDYSTTRLNNISTKLSSNVSYSKKFANTPFSMGLNMSHNQDLQTKIVDLLLPTLSVTMVNLYPLKSKKGTGFFDNLSIGYSLNGTNRITNDLGRIPLTATKDSIAAFNSANLPLFLQNAKKGIHHTPSISFSFKVLNYLNISPSVSYDERWYFDKLTWNTVKNPDPASQIPLLQSTNTKGFNRIANYSFGLGLTTRLYGTYFFKRGNVKAIRHIVNPSLSYGYTPDFSQNPNYFQVFYLDPTDEKKQHPTYKSRQDGFVYGGSSMGHSSSVGFGIGNNLEMKVKSEKDTVARKVSLLNNLSVNSSYNFLADSFNLAPFALAANTNVMNNLLNVNISGTLDPYYYHVFTDVENPGYGKEKRLHDYAWQHGGIGRITSASLAMSTNLNPKGRKKDQDTRDKIGKSQLPEPEKQYLLANPASYVDFNIPWDLNVSYNMAYSRNTFSSLTPLSSMKSTITQTLTFSGNVSLSAQWKITFNSGYHFETKEFTQTNLGISRDLHCWTMRFNWVPFGHFQSYNFTIAVKSAMLQDLKLERRKPFLDNL